MCLADGPCEEGVIGICQVTCDAAQPSQVWTINSTDSTIRLSANPTWCMTVAGEEQSNIVYMAPCSDGLATQQWIFPPSMNYAGTCIRLDAGGDRARAGYCFNIYDSGLYELSTQYGQIASGVADAPVAGYWHTLSVSVEGATVTASINGTAVFSVTDSTYASGLSCINSGWGVSYFDNFSLTA